MADPSLATPMLLDDPPSSSSPSRYQLARSRNQAQISLEAHRPIRDQTDSKTSPASQPLRVRSRQAACVSLLPLDLQGRAREW
eukprot:CAMPEP_0174694014 /NCGR_PEP_ID=MMETSP1094-20130205/645_1 /TAXON_ID=156173 /ORGANISM="Chrysochromulina brevifilum, Strain UTEX LB 985" /LENGTH=82 /DNA_ID=CAMNT_0015890107 /DNA_START=435 /DNA_END=680 /DNA_ORIENTATION=+